MTTDIRSRSGTWRSRWAALGAAVAVTLGAGGLVAVNAASSAASSFVSIDPLVRILDTRTNTGLTGPFVSGQARILQVAGSAGVPVGATSVVMNVTVIGPQTNGYVSIRPGNATGVPKTSNQNFGAGGANIANSVTVQLSTSGTINIYVQGTVRGIALDVAGYNIRAASGGGGGDVVVVSEFYDLAPLQHVSGDLLCPSGYTPVGTGHASSYLTVIALTPEGASYFLFNDSSTLDLPVLAQVSCLSGATQNGSQTALLSAERDWDGILESLIQRAEEVGGK